MIIQVFKREVKRLKVCIPLSNFEFVVFTTPIKALRVLMGTAALKRSNREVVS